MAAPSDRVRELVLGTMYYGTRVPEREAFAQLDRFVEAGGTTIDTANCYSFWSSRSGAGGQSEQVIGRWLAANPGLREQLVIATKVGVEPVTPGDFAGPLEGLSAAVIERESQRSLERLGIDQIDLYWAHGEDRATDLAETVAAFGRLVDQGRVARLGVSNHPVWRVERARAVAAAQGVEPYTALQLSTSFVRPRPDVVVPGKEGHRFGFVTDETIDYVEQHPEIEVWAYSPLIQGAYDRADRPFPQEYDHPGTTARLAVLSEAAHRLGTSCGTVVLAWLLASRPQIRPIVGVSTVEQLDAALAAAWLTLGEEGMAALDAPR